MNEADIRKYAELMKELGLTGLEITENDQVVRLERSAAGAVPGMVPNIASGSISGFPGTAPLSDAGSTAAPTKENTGYISIKSPIVGVFYAAPTENAAPFVSLGDRVEKGKTLCISEAMKLMNEICADEGGIISEICVTNGQVVEYGTELFRITR